MMHVPSILEPLTHLRTSHDCLTSQRRIVPPFLAPSVSEGPPGVKRHDFHLASPSHACGPCPDSHIKCYVSGLVRMLDELE